VVTREMIQTEVDRWSELPEDSRGDLEGHVRSYLEENIPLGERIIQRGNEQVNAVDHILEDLGSYDGT
jgi:hypothetical protein